MIDFRLLMVTDEELEPEQTLAAATEACRLGVRALQLRMRKLPGRELFHLARRLREATEGARIIVNERLDVALAAGADGVHCPERGFPVAEARRLAPGMIVGASVHSPEAALRAQEAGAHYVVLGPIFATRSKPHIEPLGLEVLEEVARKLAVPLFAIGGIDPERAALCRERGAFGVAAISALSRAERLGETIAHFDRALGGLQARASDSTETPLPAVPPSFEEVPSGRRPIAKPSSRGRSGKNVGRLHVITDIYIQDRYSHEELAERALRGGAQVIQLRDKHASSAELIEVGRRIAPLCRRYGAALILNDRLDIALAAGADGVHLGREDLPIEEARRILGPEAIIGATASSLEEAREAQEKGADYVGLGHVFSTSTKKKAGPPLGTSAVAEAAAAIDVPLVAIGGIEEGNAASVLASGAYGIAVVSAVSARPDPEEAARKLRRIVEESLSSPGKGSRAKGER